MKGGAQIVEGRNVRGGYGAWMNLEDVRIVKEKINYPAADSKCTYITDTVKILRPLVQLQNL